MSTITISATELKNDTSAILNQVIFNDAIAIVSKYGKPLVKIMRIKESDTNITDVTTLLNKYYGTAVDFPEVHKNRPLAKKDLVIEE